MTAPTLKFNSKFVPLDTVRSIRPITEEDRAKLAEKFPEVDCTRFNTRIEFADKTTKLAEETLDQIKEQGIGLVNLGNDKFVPATNITGAAAFTKDDATKLKGEDYTLAQTFRSRVDTKAGTMLSSAMPNQIMDRRATALEQPGKQAKSKTGPAR